MLFSLPDVIWRKLLEKLTIEDQFRLKRVCKQGIEKMRHLNSGVTTMVISTWADREEVKSAVNELSLASVPSMQLALSAGDDKFELFADYPTTTAPPSNWAYLMLRSNQLLNSDTIESIVDIFSGVTDLKFEPLLSVRILEIEMINEWATTLNWLKLEQTLPNLQDQFRLKRVCKQGAEKMRHLTSGVTTLVISTWADREEVKSAVNELSLASVPSMQLALSTGDDKFELFADYPATAAHPSKWAYLMLRNNQLFNSNTIEAIVDTFPAVTDLKFFGYGNASCKNLTALLKHHKVQIDGEEQLEPVFTALAQLPRLVHLELDISIWKKYSHFGRFLKPLPSVRALNIILIKNWHSNLSWMDLAHTLPNLKTIHVYDFNCEECDVSYWSKNNGSVQEYNEDTTPNLTTANNCFRTTLGQLHANVPHDRIILGKQTPHRTLQQQLAPNVRQ
ncbi:hypothetical protein TYRP_017504, partial [Tyrophagus putrescentiae]